MKILLIIFIFLFSFLAAISIGLSAIKFTQSQKKKYPVLKKTDGKKLHLFVFFITFTFLAYGMNAYKEAKFSSDMDLYIGIDGELLIRANLNGFNKELSEEVAARFSESKSYFKAGERDEKNYQLKDAVKNYQKSIDIVPTMAAYLNLYNCLTTLSRPQESKFMGQKGSDL